MTAQDIRKSIDNFDRQFNELDIKRVKAVSNGEYDVAERIEKQLDTIVSRVEQLRAMLRENS